VRIKLFNAMLYVIEQMACYSECSPKVCVSMKILSSVVQLHANNEIRAQTQQLAQKLTKPDSNLSDNVASLNQNYKNL